MKIKFIFVINVMKMKKILTGKIIKMSYIRNLDE